MYFSPKAKETLHRGCHLIKTRGRQRQELPGTPPPQCQAEPTGEGAPLGSCRLICHLRAFIKIQENLSGRVRLKIISKGIEERACKSAADRDPLTGGKELKPQPLPNLSQGQPAKSPGGVVPVWQEVGGHTVTMAFQMRVQKCHPQLGGGEICCVEPEDALREGGFGQQKASKGERRRKRGCPEERACEVAGRNGTLSVGHWLLKGEEAPESLRGRERGPCQGRGEEALSLAGPGKGGSRARVGKGCLSPLPSLGHHETRLPSCNFLPSLEENGCDTWKPLWS